MAVSHYIEAQTPWSTRKFVRTTRRYRTVIIKAGNQTPTPPTHYPTTRAKCTSRSAPTVPTKLSQVGTTPTAKALRGLPGWA